MMLVPVLIRELGKRKPLRLVGKEKASKILAAKEKASGVLAEEKKASE